MEIRGVEIFRTGTWNHDTYTRADLDAMVAAFPEVGFNPPVILGHSKAPDAPAAGWVEKIRRVGDKLVADFRDVPKEIFKAIKEHRFDQVSSEIFWNLERNGRKFKRVLRAVALLGADVPAVSGLAPLRSVVNVINCETRAYTLDMEEGDHRMQTQEHETASARIDRAARDYIYNNPAAGLNYSQAVQIVLDREPELVARFASETTADTAAHFYSARDQHRRDRADDPSADLAERVRDLIASLRAEGTEVAYVEVAKRVLAENPKLADRWASYTTQSGRRYAGGAS